MCKLLIILFIIRLYARFNVFNNKVVFKFSKNVELKIVNDPNKGYER